jgi:hypothetical protein
MMVFRKSFPCQGIESRRHPKQNHRLSAILSSQISVYVLSGFKTFDIFPKLVLGHADAEILVVALLYLRPARTSLVTG